MVPRNSPPMEIRRTETSASTLPLEPTTREAFDLTLPLITPSIFDSLGKGDFSYNLHPLAQEAYDRLRDFPS